MTDFPELLIVFYASVNPASAAAVNLAARAVRDAVVPALVAMGTAAALLLLASLTADPVLSWLDVAPETFRVAAGTVMAITGLRWVWGGRPWWSDGQPLDRPVAAVFPLAWPAIANPAAVAAAMAMALDAGRAETIAAWAPMAAAGAVLGSGVISGRNARIAGALSQLTGLLTVAAGVALVVDGVRAV